MGADVIIFWTTGVFCIGLCFGMAFAVWIMT